MERFAGFRSERGCSLLGIGGWALAVIFGGLLLWFGFFRPVGQQGPPATEQSPTASATAEALPTAAVPTSAPTVAPTDTPPPSPTTAPTPVQPTAVPVVAEIVTGADGANVRSGPSVDFARIGYIDPGGEAQVTGRYADWWQIAYEDGAGWVFGGIVTASNTDGVPEVQPPPSPTPPPATATFTPAPTATEGPPTATPGPRTVRGLVPNSFKVEGAPGPYSPSSTSQSCGSDNGAIWYNMDITSNSQSEVNYTILGAWVQESQYHKPSWTNQRFKPGQQLIWRDCLRIPSAGSYNLWLVICFNDGVCEKMLGPVSVEVR
jgi:uncharacterized protein YraI